MNRKAYVRASGRYIPERVVTNDDLAKLMTTSDEWIQRRSGIKERHYCDEGDRCSDATLSPDIHFPGTGVIMQQKLGWADRHIPCFDIRQQCSGFVYGLQMAQSFVESGMFENVLVVGSELHSNALEFNNDKNK